MRLLLLIHNPPLWGGISTSNVKLRQLSMAWLGQVMPGHALLHRQLAGAILAAGDSRQIGMGALRGAGSRVTSQPVGQLERQPGGGFLLPS